MGGRKRPPAYWELAMRIISTVWAGVVLVSGLVLAKLHAEEMPDLKDPKDDCCRS